MSKDATIDETQVEAGAKSSRARDADPLALMLMTSPVRASVGEIFELRVGANVIERVYSDGEADGRMSRQHATIEWTPSRSGESGKTEPSLTLRDGAATDAGWKRSANHTYVSGVEIGAATVDLRLGQPIRTGRSLWMVCRAPTPRPPESLLRGPSQALRLAREELALAVERVADCLEKGERVRQSLLILGPRGSGKQVVAREAHRLLSERLGRSNVPFREVAAPTLADGTGVADLFGVVDHYATGTKARAGYFEQAHGGVLFLDEVADTPASEQAKLLHVLQERSVTRLGGHQPQPFDCLVIAATNRSLEALAETGTFRRDLIDRLARFRVSLPPLDERLEDIPELASTLLDRHGYQSALAFDSVEALLARHWPGSVRELDVAMERAAAIAAIEQVPIDADIVQRAAAAIQPNARASAPSTPIGSPPPNSAPDRLKSRPERAELIAELERHGWNKAAVARVYAKDPRQISRWMARYGIDRPGTADR